MVLFYITVMSLDIALGVVWWTTKTTAWGIYKGVRYMIYGPEIITTTNKDDLMKEIQKLQKQIEYTSLK
jgi:hypothetical protein